MESGPTDRRQAGIVLARCKAPGCGQRIWLMTDGTWEHADSETPADGHEAQHEATHE